MTDPIRIFRDPSDLSKELLYIPENKTIATACDNCSYCTPSGVCLMAETASIYAYKKFWTTPGGVCKLAVMVNPCKDCKYSYIKGKVFMCRRFVFSWRYERPSNISCRLARWNERVCGKNGKYFRHKIEDIIENIEG